MLENHLTYKTKFLKLLVEKWRKVPPGTSVAVLKDNGEKFYTKTRSEPWLLGADTSGHGGHTAVIMVDGIAGCYNLERIELIDTTDT
jgi:hypothetical protein